MLDELRGSDNADRHSLAMLSHIVVNTLVDDLVKASEKRFETICDESMRMDSVDSKSIFSEYDKLGFSIKRHEVIDFSEKIKPGEFKEKIREAIHHSRNVERMNEKGKYIIRKLFEAYYAHPQQLTDGAILQVLLEAGVEGYETIQKAKENSRGEARIQFDKLLKNRMFMLKFFLCEESAIILLL